MKRIVSFLEFRVGLRLNGRKMLKFFSHKNRASSPFRSIRIFANISATLLPYLRDLRGARGRHQSPSATFFQCVFWVSAANGRRRVTWYIFISDGQPISRYLQHRRRRGITYRYGRFLLSRLNAPQHTAWWKIATTSIVLQLLPYSNRKRFAVT